MALTDIKVRTTELKVKQYKLADAMMMHHVVRPNF